MAQIAPLWLSAELFIAELLECILSLLELLFVLHEQSNHTTLRPLWHHCRYLIQLFLDQLEIAVHVRSIESDLLQWVLVLHSHIDVELADYDVIWF